jgi:tetratricopeptide (TPR) repeat protein
VRGVVFLAAAFTAVAVESPSADGDRQCSANDIMQTPEQLTSRAQDLVHIKPISALEGANAVLARLQPIIAAAEGAWVKDSLTWAEALMTAGRAHFQLGQHSQATATMSQSVAELERSPPRTTDRRGRPLEMEIISGKFEVSWAYSSAGQHPPALEQLRQARLFAPKGESEREHFDMVASLAEARAYRCAGLLPEAQASFERGLALSQQFGEFSNNRARMVTALNQYVEVLNWQGFLTEARLVSADLARLAGWPDPMQRAVHHYTPNLTTTGWLQPNAYKEVQAAVSVLEHAYPSLLREYLQLERHADSAHTDDGDSSAVLSRQSECLHEPTKGEWRYHGVIGDAGVGQCSGLTPVACELAASLAKLVPSASAGAGTTGVTHGGAGVVGGAGAREAGDTQQSWIRRVGYSAIGPGGWIRPHTGVDNRLLKLHLGLVVPTNTLDPSTSTRAVEGACVTFTVGGETRTWAEGGVLFFDDSFEHEVRNSCLQTRVVLQVVLQHPLLI